MDLSAWNDVRSEIISIAKRLQATRVKVEPGVEAEVPAAVLAGVKVEPGAKVEPGVKAEVKAEPNIRVINKSERPGKHRRPLRNLEGIRGDNSFLKTKDTKSRTPQLSEKCHGSCLKNLWYR